MLRIPIKSPVAKVEPGSRGRASARKNYFCYLHQLISFTELGSIYCSRTVRQMKAGESYDYCINPPDIVIVLYCRLRNRSYNETAKEV